MSRLTLTVLMYAIGIGSAVLSGSRVSLYLVLGSAAALTAAYATRGVLLTFLAGWLMYYPVGLVLSAYVGVVGGFLASGFIVVLLAERLSFDAEISGVLESPSGVDAEVKTRALELSHEHSRQLLMLSGAFAAVAAVSIPVAKVTPYAGVLVASAVLLMFLLRSYARR
jgi:hypothetical protein